AIKQALRRRLIAIYARRQMVLESGLRGKITRSDISTQIMKYQEQMRAIVKDLLAVKKVVIDYTEADTYILQLKQKLKKRPKFDEEITNWALDAIETEEDAVLSDANMRDEDQKVKFVPSTDVSAIWDFPLRKGNDENGAVTILEAPFRDLDNSIPRGMYCIGHDPYAIDKSSTSGSIGAALVIKRTNNFSPTLNHCIVASYIGRPNNQDEYNRNLFMLAEYYGCKIGFENDRGDTIGYGKRFKLLHYLEEEFEMLDKRELQSRRVNRPYGMHMTEARKNQGEIYIRDWLNEAVRFEEGEATMLRLNTILDPALLQELIKFNRDGNFDRVMALMIAMYYLKELHNAQVAPRRKSAHADFFSRDLFI
ncbi:hypothetical protein LCGC14_2610440, partial [marine sediment metagenome]